MTSPTPKLPGASCFDFTCCKQCPNLRAANVAVVSYFLLSSLMRLSLPLLVTGSSGRLGQAIVGLLRAQGYAVIGADLVPAPTTDTLLDIRDAQAVLAATRGVGAILHTAALHGLHYEQQVPRLEFVRTNIEGTLNLLTASVTHGLEKFIYTSTTSIYGHAMENAHQAVWVDEELVPQPRDIYDITKQAGESLCRNFCEQEELPTTVLRVSRFLSEPANTALNHRLYRGLDARDGAVGHLLALEHSFSGFNVFNIAAGSPFLRDDLALLKHHPAEVIQRRLPEAAAVYARRGWTFPSSIDRVYSIEKAQRLLGYAPTYTAQYLLQQAAAT